MQIEEGRMLHQPQRTELAQLSYSTCIVIHPRTNQAQCCLTSVIGRELVFQYGYGHRALLFTLQVTSHHGRFKLLHELVEDREAREKE